LPGTIVNLKIVKQKKEEANAKLKEANEELEYTLDLLARSGN